MKKNYYDELIEKIENLIKKNNINRALNLIKEELSLPYVPKIYEEKLYFYLNKFEKEEDKEKIKSTFSREEVIQIFEEYKKHDFDFLLNISYGFDEHNWRGYENKIQKIFSIKNIDPKILSIIYNSLVIQEINYDFKINNFFINPFKNKTIFETKFSLKNLKLINEKCLNNNSLLNISEQIFFIYLMNNFPNSLFFEYYDVSQNFFNIANVMLGLKDVDILNEKEIKYYNSIKGK